MEKKACPICGRSGVLGSGVCDLRRSALMTSICAADAFTLNNAE